MSIITFALTIVVPARSWIEKKCKHVDVEKEADTDYYRDNLPLHTIFHAYS